MTTKLNVAACLKAIDESRATEALDEFVRDAAHVSHREHRHTGK